MNPGKATGLGEPEPVGKKSLFQPPELTQEPAKPKVRKVNKPNPIARVRMTLEMTKESLAIIQEHQSRYRLDTGRALPKWKIISEALALYDRETKGKGSE